MGTVEPDGVLGWVNVGGGVGVELAPSCPQGGCGQEEEANGSMRVLWGGESHVGATWAARALPPH